MAEFNPSKSSVTDVASNITDYSVDSKATDYVTANKEETYWDFPNATKNIGYYKTIPELKKAIDALATWVVGKGFQTNVANEIDLEHLEGWGEDTIQSILWNMIVMKKVCGDSFAEIITQDNRLINLKPISPERVRLVIANNGLIKRYDIRKADGNFQPMDKEKILHLSNDRIADEIHGTSVITVCQWAIDARHEALTDERMIKHRELALGILYVDTEDATKRDAIITQYQDAITKGEVLVLPKDGAELEDSKVKPQDRLPWIKYLENFFYQAVGIPRVIATSQDYTEAGSKVGYLTFEPIYTAEQTLLEADLWNQLAIKITFNRPPSLKDEVQESEAKNTGQVGFQPKETEVNLQRE